MQETTPRELLQWVGRYWLLYIFFSHCQLWLFILLYLVQCAYLFPRCLIYLNFRDCFWPKCSLYTLCHVLLMAKLLHLVVDMHVFNLELKSFLIHFCTSPSSSCEALLLSLSDAGLIYGIQVFRYLQICMCFGLTLHISCVLTCLLYLTIL